MEQISDYRNSLNLIYDLNEKIKETSYYWVQKWVQNNMPEYNESFLDSVSQGQYDSKNWLKQELIKFKQDLNNQEYNSNDAALDRREAATNARLRGELMRMEGRARQKASRFQAAGTLLSGAAQTAMMG